MADLAPYLQALRRHANRVPCPRPRCLQPAGATCIRKDGQPYGKAQAAHDERITAADHAAALRVECRDDLGGCAAQPDEPCRDDLGRLLHGRHLDHRIRLEVADVWRPPVDAHDLKGWPHRVSEDVRRRRGLAELERSRARALALERRVELKGNEKAGQLTQHERMQLIDLDRVIAAADDPELATGPGDEDEGDEDRMDYRTGPGGRR